MKLVQPQLDGPPPDVARLDDLIASLRPDEREKAEIAAMFAWLWESAVTPIRFDGRAGPGVTLVATAPAGQFGAKP